MAVPAAPISTATPEMSELLTKIISRQVISTLRTGRYFLPPGAVLFETYPAGGGHTDEYVLGSYEDLVIDPAALASYVLAEGVTPNAVAFGSDVNSFLTTEYARLVTVTSEQIRTNPAPGGFFTVIAEKVANAAQDLIDAVAQTLWMSYSGKAPVILPGATPAAANKLDTMAILKAVVSLQSRGVPPIDGTNYGAMVTPAVGATIMAEQNATGGMVGWTDAMKYAGPDRLVTGEIGTYRGVRFFVNSRIPAKTGSVFPTFVFGKDALAWADLSSLRVTSVRPTPSISDPLAQRGAAGFAVRAGGMLISDLDPTGTTRRYRFVVIESTADPLLASA